jgi:hypothetical protein
MFVLPICHLLLLVSIYGLLIAFAGTELGERLWPLVLQPLWLVYLADYPILWLVRHQEQINQDPLMKIAILGTFQWFFIGMLVRLWQIRSAMKLHKRNSHE